jgi:hypothetical protein
LDENTKEKNHHENWGQGLHRISDSSIKNIQTFDVDNKVGKKLEQYNIVMY